MIKKFLKNEDNKTLVSNYFSLLILQIANYLLPLLILPFLVRVLGAEKFGLIMFAQSLAVFLTVFVDFGFNISGTREISLSRDNKEKLSEIFSAIMLLKVGLIVIAFLIISALVNVFSRFSIDKEVYLLSFGVVIGQALFPVWFFQGIEKMKFVTLVNLTAKLIFTLLVFVLIRVESDYIYVPVYNSLGFIIAGLLGFLLCFRHVSIKMPSINTMKRLMSDSSSLFVSNFATTLYTSSNVFILGIFTDNTIVGVYSSMEKLVVAIKNMYSPLYQALFPWLAKQVDVKKIRNINKMTPYILLIGVAITTVVLLFGDFILEVIYDDELISSWSIILKTLSLIAIFSGLNMLYLSLYFPAIKMYKLRMKILVIAGITNLLLSFILVELFGIYGTTITFVTTEFLILVLGAFYFRKFTKV